MTKITIDRSVVEQALEALEKHQEALRVWPEHTLAPHECVAMDASGKAITAIRAALAEPVQEPVAWHYTNNGGGNVMHWGPSARLDADIQAAKDYPRVHKVTPLYTAPPQRPAEPVQEPCEPLEALKRALEIIAVGDSKNPQQDASDALIDIGFWSGEGAAR